eukprot:scaffold12749_cov107-Cylindrotheca_fusiformis.AAC.5
MTEASLLSFTTYYYDQLSEYLQTNKEFQDVFWQATTIVTSTLVLTVVLELISMDTVKGVWKQPNGKELYIKSILLNVANPAFFGVPLYSVAVPWLCHSKTAEDDNYARSSHHLLLLRDVSEVIWVLAVHAICYYQIHKMFHESPRLYRYHKYHHRFNTYVPPSAANAVSFQEYISAYLLPFVLAVSMRQTSVENLAIAVWINSIANILVHTPKLEGIHDYGEYLVSTANHLDHHRKLKVHYASPTFNIDTLVAKVVSSDGDDKN